MVLRRRAGTAYFQSCKGSGSGVVTDDTVLPWVEGDNMSSVVAWEVVLGQRYDKSGYDGF